MKKERTDWTARIIYAITLATGSYAIKACQKHDFEFKPPTTNAWHAGEEKPAKVHRDTWQQKTNAPPVTANGSEPTPVANKSIDLEPFSRVGYEIFPSRVINGASLPQSPNQAKADEAPHYGGHGMIGLIIRNVHRGETFHVSITGDRFISESTGTYTMESDARIVVIHPPISYDFQALRRNYQTSTVNVTIKARRTNQHDEYIAKHTWQVHQINDCPMGLGILQVLRDGSTKMEYFSSSKTITAYVNENHPWIDSILVEARKTGICNEFIGYQGGQEKIYPQIASIWKALQNRGLTYSNIAQTTESKQNSLQHVRFIEQTLATSQANCLDGSVLLTSILRKIGLNVGVMLVPGHAYVAVCDETNSHFIFAIETTLMGKADLNQAIRVATRNGVYPLTQYNTKDYNFIDVGELRRMGYLPIPFESDTPIQEPLSDKSGSSIGSAEEIARQQRIIISNGLRQRVAELLSRLNERNTPGFKSEAHELFAEIRKHQSAFNSLSTYPKLVSTGIAASDQSLQERYYANIQTLKSRPIDLNPDISDYDLQSARELSDALFGIASLPLNF